MGTPGPETAFVEEAQTFAEAAVAAGALVMDVYARAFIIREKKDHSPVCEADERSEALIVRHLERVFPHLPVVAEEAFASGRVPELGGDFILVDPLDGTREFAKRNGEFTINIALIRDGAPVCGALYAPVLGRLWVGAGRAFACTVEPGGKVVPIERMRPIAVRALDGRAPLALISRSHLNDETEALMRRFGAAEKRQAGSAMKFCLIAEGQGDVYPRVGPTMEWDIAAGDAVLRAAGGLVTDLSGAPLLYGRRAAGFAAPDFVAVGDRRLLERL